MKLETHEGRFLDPITDDLIARVVAGLTTIGEAYVILDDDVSIETYVQAAGTVGEEFLVEYRDGRAGDHYRGDRRLTAAALVELLVAYLHRVPRWQDALTWHRVRVEQPPPAA